MNLFYNYLNSTFFNYKLNIIKNKIVKFFKNKFKSLIKIIFNLKLIIFKFKFYFIIFNKKNLKKKAIIYPFTLNVSEIIVQIIITHIISILLETSLHFPQATSEE